MAEPDPPRGLSQPLQALATLILLGLGLGLLSGVDLPLDVDFVAIWTAARGVFEGVSPYDEVGQRALLAADGQANTLPPFAYPPWFVVAALPLGWLSRPVAAAAWMMLNLGMLLGAVMVVCRDLEVRRMAVLGLVAVTYLPTLGVLVVGQFTHLALFGTVLAIEAVRRREPAWLAVALALLALKPHLGLLPALAALATILVSPGDPKRPAMLGAAGATGVLGLAVSTVLVPDWFSAWPAALGRFRPWLIDTCDTCSSAPWTLMEATGLGLDPVAALLAVVCVPAVAWRLRSTSVQVRLAGALCLAPLVLPYLRNYDYALLVLPMLELARRSSPGARVAVALAWAAPVVSLLAGRGALSWIWWASSAGMLLVLLVEAEPGER